MSVAGSGNSTLTVTTASTTPTGTYTLTITGMSGSLTHSTTVNLVVNAPPDFSISASPSSQTVTQGNSTTYTTTISALNGFTGTVSFSVSGLPTGATGSFNPTSVAGSGNSTLTVMTASTTPAGTYTLTITGISGSLTHSTPVSFVVNTATGGLPSRWTDLDIGSPALAGSTTYNSGTFTVKGGGADIWRSSDQFNYAYKSSSGNVTITARVASEHNTNGWAKAGVMIRDTTAANSAYAFAIVSPSNGVAFQYRPSTGAWVAQSDQINGVTPPYWVRLVRSGSTFTAYSSPDGVTWTQIGNSVTVTLGTSPNEGLAVTSHNNTALNTSTFDNVTMP
jgi:hypothetical protein